MDEERRFRSSDCGEAVYDGGAGLGGVDGERSLSVDILPTGAGEINKCSVCTFILAAPYDTEFTLHRGESPPTPTEANETRTSCMENKVQRPSISKSNCIEPTSAAGSQKGNKRVEATGVITEKIRRESKGGVDGRGHLESWSVIM